MNKFVNRKTIKVLHDSIDMIVDFVCAAKLVRLVTRRKCQRLKRWAQDWRDIFQECWEGMLKLSFISLYIVCIHKFSVPVAEFALWVRDFHQNRYKLVMGLQSWSTAPLLSESRGWGIKDPYCIAADDII